MVHSLTKEEDVQVSVWPICMDAYDPYRGFHTVFLYGCQYLRRDFLVIKLVDCLMFISLSRHKFE